MYLISTSCHYRHVLDKLLLENNILIASDCSNITHTHPFNGPFPELPNWAGTRKVKPIWILLKQETVSGRGISWAICKSAPCSRQITMPTPHHSVFLQAGCPSCRPTNSVKALKADCSNIINQKHKQWLSLMSRQHIRFWFKFGIDSSCKLLFPYKSSTPHISYRINIADISKTSLCSASYER